MKLSIFIIAYILMIPNIYAETSTTGWHRGWMNTGGSAPPPPPSTFCGDATCNAGESPFTCPADCPVVTTYRIMPVGDSITEGAGQNGNFGWRKKFQQGFPTLANVHMVGGYSLPASDPTYGVRHLGLSGAETSVITGNLFTWLPINFYQNGFGAPVNTEDAFIEVLHAGTNDIAHSVAHATILSNIAYLIDFALNSVLNNTLSDSLLSFLGIKVEA